jgi:hypothetical protein
MASDEPAGGVAVRVEAIVVPLPPGVSGRMECGPVQFGDDDWPGVWLRGDYALAHAMYVDQAADRIEAADPLGWLDAMYLRGLAKQLRSCDVRLHNEPAQGQSREAAESRGAPRSATTPDANGE